MKIHGLAGSLGLGLAAVTLAGCHNYVKRSEFDATVAELRGDVSASRAESREQIASLGRDLEGKLKNQEVAITDLQDRLVLNMTAHFEFDKANLRPQDEQALNDVAGVLRKRPSMEVTVEGFADSAGSPAYNKKLGQRRAEAVREHLIASGLPAENIKAVSYGAQKSHQVVPGAWGVEGKANRRVALVVEPGADRVGAIDPAINPAASQVSTADRAETTKGAGH